MEWVFDHVKLGHRLFIAFIELKIEGSWKKYNIKDDFNTSHEVLTANSEYSYVHVIEPDGLRRIFHFNEGGTISIHQNILSYQPEQIEEITVDEKEQAGKGKTRDILD